jgi:hypothetical protein
MTPTILFRKDLNTEAEFEIAQQYFPVVDHRAACPPDTLVIPRYSALPYYRELEKDIQWQGGALVNSWRQHRWIANFDYYSELREFTPETWDDYTFPDAPEGQFVVKGRTNSRKFDWNKLMFAENKRQAAQIGAELSMSHLIGPQGLIYRRYIPLKTFELGLNGLPFTNEWRFFFYQGTLLSYGYYWSSALEETIAKAVLSEAGFGMAQQIANICKDHVSFFVLDMAETAEGDWILIEVNDGQMSGLSENDPHRLYSNLRKAVWQPERVGE